MSGVYQTKHFYIGFKYPVPPTKNGTIYLNGQDFAGTWYEDPKHGWIKTPGYALNRHGLAIDMGLPVHAHFETLEALLAYLEGWYEETQSNKEEGHYAYEIPKSGCYCSICEASRAAITNRTSGS